MNILKSRTIIFAVLLAALSVVQGYVELLQLTPVRQMLVGIVISVAIAVLRAITTQPLAEKK